MLPEDNRHQGGLGSSGVRVLVVNRADSASINIRDRLLETGDWVDTGSTFRGHPMHQRGYDVLVEVDGPTIHDEALSDDLLNLEWPIHAVWFLSRHAAASGQPSFTVHPIGNPGDAPYGGQPGTFSPCALVAVVRQSFLCRGTASSILNLVALSWMKVSFFSFRTCSDCS